MGPDRRRHGRVTLEGEAEKEEGKSANTNDRAAAGAETQGAKPSAKPGSGRKSSKALSAWLH